MASLEQRLDTLERTQKNFQERLKMLEDDMRLLKTTELEGEDEDEDWDEDDEDLDEDEEDEEGEVKKEKL